MLDWLDLQKNVTFKKLLDPEIISSWLSSNYLEKVLEVFKDQEGLQTELLLRFLNRISSHIKFTAKLVDLGTF